MNENPVIVVFLDCLGYEEAITCDWIGSKIKGKINSGIPRVTPYVVSGILTGKTPAHHGILCPTKLNKPNPQRPLCETIIEKLSHNRRVLNFEIPFTMNLQGRYLTNIGSGIQAIQQQRPAVFSIPRPAGLFWKDDVEKILQSHIDFIRAVFAISRNTLRHDNYDVIFLAIRELDSFGHFLYKEERERLLWYIDFEMEETAKMGDVPIVFFSDHGITDKKHTFYINKWFQEKGWLDYDIFMPGWEKAMQADDDKMEAISVHSPFVAIKDTSYFVSPDAFDSGILILRDDAPVEEMKSELMKTGFFNSVNNVHDLYGDGKYVNDLGCDIMPDTADGIMVSGNIHPNLTDIVDANNYCQCAIRTGVHSRFGVWGDNNSIPKKEITYLPETFSAVLYEFIDEHAPIPRTEELYGIPTEESQVENRLKDLGYI